MKSKLLDQDVYLVFLVNQGLIVGCLPTGTSSMTKSSWRREALGQN